MAAWNRVSWGDLFTLANGILGFIAITYILDREFVSAIGLLLVSTMMDGLDGYIARKFGSKHSMGQVLDSISDSISFAFAPALLIYAEFHRSTNSVPENLLVLACAIAILGCGLFRLARFSARGYQLSYFVGMPAPAAALFIVLICLLFGSSDGAEDPKFYFVLAETMWLVLGAGILASFLMASEIPYPKIEGWMTALSGLAILLAVIPYTAGLLLVDDQTLYRTFSRTATSIALAFTAVYVFGGPVYAKVKGIHS